MDNFIQITVFCPPEPRIGTFVYRNAGKVYSKFYWFVSLFHKNYETFFLEKVIPFLKEIFEIAMETNLRTACAEKGKCGFQNSDQRHFFG